MPILPPQRDAFDIPADVAYLNCAYMSPLSHRVAEAGRRALERKSRPWQLVAADFFEGTDRARAAFARLLGPPADPDDVAIVPAASYGMATAALNLPVAPGRRVIVLAEEFPSTILTWRERARTAGAELVMVPRPADDDWTGAVIDRIDQRTAVAALPACHWVDGARLDLARIGDRLRAAGAALVLDLTQSLGVMPFDLGAVDPDYLVAACYKWLMGPYAIGFCYVAPRRREGRPLEHNWFAREGSENFSGLTSYPERFQPGARRFDMGEAANLCLLPAAVAGLEQVLDWEVANVYETAGDLADQILTRTADLGFSAVPAGLRARHYLGLRADRPLPPDLVERLAAERVYLSVRGGNTLRITPHVYNDRTDIDQLLGVLQSAGARP